jgi:HD superfamily phosphohydrolase
MLSKKLAELIMEYQKKLGVTKMDVLCICMAGLCHDLGHGELRSKYF